MDFAHFSEKMEGGVSPPPPLLTPVPMLNTNAGITIAFTESEYTTPNENDAFNEVCATITDGEIDRDVTFSITSVSGGTATGKLQSNSNNS